MKQTFQALLLCSCGSPIHYFVALTPNFVYGPSGIIWTPVENHWFSWSGKKMPSVHCLICYENNYRWISNYHRWHRDGKCGIWHHFFIYSRRNGEGGGQIYVCIARTQISRAIQQNHIISVVAVLLLIFFLAVVVLNHHRSTYLADLFWKLIRIWLFCCCRWTYKYVIQNFLHVHERATWDLKVIQLLFLASKSINSI